MMAELKKCPFHNCLTCGCYDCVDIPDEQWNTRPIEDALQARIDGLEAQLRWRLVSKGNLPDYIQKVEIHDRIEGTVMLARHTARIPQWSSDDGLYFHGNNYERIDKWRPIPKLPKESA